MSDQDSRLRLILNEMSNLYSNSNGNTTININFYDNYNEYNGNPPINNRLDEDLTEITATVSIPNNSSNIVNETQNINTNQTVEQHQNNNIQSTTNITGTNNSTRTLVSRVIPLISSGNLSDILNNNLTDIINNVTNNLETNDSMTIIGQQLQPISTANSNNYLTIQQLNQNTNVFITEELQEKCSICNESFQDDPICRRNIICNHYFHRGCIDTWYSNHNKCPVCNVNIVQN